MTKNTMVVGFTGERDWGEVAEGTLTYLIEHFDSYEHMTIAPEQFYIHTSQSCCDAMDSNRPYSIIEEGILKNIEMPEILLYKASKSNLFFFTGPEPHHNWESFSKSFYSICRQLGIKQVYSVESFTGATPHTREPLVSFAVSDHRKWQTWKALGLCPFSFQGVSSINSFLLSRSQAEHVNMTGLFFETPSYIQGHNSKCIETSVRLFSRILQIPIECSELQERTIAFQMRVAELISDEPDLEQKIHELERIYDHNAFSRNIGHTGSVSDIKEICRQEHH